jgi:hypothetical protein
MSGRKIIPPEVLLESYQRNAGNITATAKDLGADRQTVRKCLALYGADKKPVTGGSVKPLKHNVMPLPEKGKVKRYLLSCAQNNTKVFAPFLRNLEAYAEWLGDCQIMVARFTYNKNAFNNPKSQKPGTIKVADQEDCWFDESILKYVCDDPELHGTRRWQLAPDLYFAAEMNISPSAVRPLSDLKSYTGTASTIFPHCKIALESVPVMPGTPAKFIYTTGCLTARNYIQKKAGLKAEFHHVFGALIVEVTDSGDWYVRQLVADSQGNFFDCPGGNVLKVANTEVSEGFRAEAVSWGDIHVAELDEDRMHRYWGNKDSIIDALKPKYQFFNDLFSMRSRSHHEMRSFGKMLEKHVNGQELVQDEVDKTAHFLGFSERQYCTSVTVCSNHDRHLEKYLDEVNYRHDIVNVEFFLRAQLDRVQTIKRGEQWNGLEWAMRTAGAPETIRYLGIDESFTICSKVNHPIECGLHGDLGPNGSRGSTANLSTLGARVNKGHSHSTEIRDGVYSAGTMSLKHSYNHGPTSWSLSHIITYSSGKRTIVSERNNRLWA